MICRICGTNNENGFRFCVKCGSNIENPSETNYEQVDMGNYHTEEEFADERKSFTMDTGTFVIRDTVSQPANNIYTADELNRSDEEFDFSMFDESAMSELPSAPQPPQQQQVYSQPQNVYGGQQPQNVNPYIQQPMVYQQPQIIGYDPTGMPIYGQPQMMYQQPQIIGYDPTGMPIYGQPQMMYQQPQIIGYDPTGMPIYGQPQMMYQQPQIIGYDPSGMPVYAQQPVQPMNSPIQPQGMMNGIPNMQQNMMQGTVNPPEAPHSSAPKQEDTPKEEEKNDFWTFFNGGNNEAHHDTTEADFFGKANKEQPVPDDPFADIDNRRKKRLQEEARSSLMGDTPIVDASKLEHNDSNRINKLYMRQTGNSRSADLTAASGKHRQGCMESTMAVNADMLSENLSMRSRITMQIANEANADDIEAYVPEHREALMAQADHAVQAMPKKINPYESELDRIELPEYMQARKTVHEDQDKIPSIPEV